LNARTYRFGKRRGVTDDQIAALKQPGGWKTSLFTPEQQAAIQFAERLTGYPGGVDENDIDALGKHFDQEQIVELAATIATAISPTGSTRASKLRWTCEGRAALGTERDERSAHGD
jgi:hypothetical protein